jgi:hypothetical protein
VARFTSRFGLFAGLFLVAFLGRALSPARAQKEGKGETPKEVLNRLLLEAEDEYRLKFKRPKTAPEFWAVIGYEMDVGKFDLAALFLDQLLKLEPAKEVDRDLAAIEELKGISAFLRFRQVRKWHDQPALEKDAQRNVELLIDRVTAAVKQRLSDPARITKLIKGLTALTPEERAYAFVQLKRTRENAAPYLLDALRLKTDPSDQARLLDVMTRLDSAIMPPLFDALRARSPKDAQDVDMRMALLDLIKRRGDKRAIPYLWHLAAASYYPAPVRLRARQALASLLDTDVEKLPPSREALTELAEQYFQHKVKFIDPRTVLIWPWDGKQLARKPDAVPAHLAEQAFGFLYAQQALDLDPAYRPAQEVYLNLILEEAFAAELDQVLQKKAPPAMQRLLGSIDGELLLQVLERALSDRNVAVILPLVRALGERGEFRSALTTGGGPARGLQRALYYPDRRVQMAAVKAFLRMPTIPEPATSARILDILRRFVLAEPTPRALAVAFPQELVPEVRKALKGAGFDAVVAPSSKAAMETLQAAADIDVVLIHHALGLQELPFLLSQIRADRNTGLLPVLLVYSAPTKEGLARAVKRFQNVRLLPEGMLAMPDDLKDRIEESIKLGMAPDYVGQLPPVQRAWAEANLVKREGSKLSNPERKLYAQEAMDALEGMAKGEIKGYDLQPLRQTILKLMNSQELGPQAIEVAGRFPGAEPQQRLANLAADPAGGKLRLAAARELNRSIRHNGLLLSPLQVAAIKRALANPKEDGSLRAELAMVVGQLGLGSRLTGIQLRNYSPDLPPPEKEKEKEKKE